MTKPSYGDTSRAVVQKPDPITGGGCWVAKRLYVGSLCSQHGSCRKAPRSGHLTCHWHAKYEDEAQRLKKRA